MKDRPTKLLMEYLNKLVKLYVLLFTEVKKLYCININNFN